MLIRWVSTSTVISMYCVQISLGRSAGQERPTIVMKGGCCESNQCDASNSSISQISLGQCPVPRTSSANIMAYWSSEQSDKHHNICQGTSTHDRTANLAAVPCSGLVPIQALTATTWGNVVQTQAGEHLSTVLRLTTGNHHH